MAPRANTPIYLGSNPSVANSLTVLVYRKAPGSLKNRAGKSQEPPPHCHHSPPIHPSTHPASQRWPAPESFEGVESPAASCRGQDWRTENGRPLQHGKSEGAHEHERLTMNDGLLVVALLMQLAIVAGVVAVLVLRRIRARSVKRIDDFREEMRRGGRMSTGKIPAARPQPAARPTPAPAPAAPVASADSSAYTLYPSALDWKVPSCVGERGTEPVMASGGGGDFGGAGASGSWDSGSCSSDSYSSSSDSSSSCSSSSD